ncbi:MAG: hypothetical protein H6737_09315 [Alphaproteobacteria bacterium]|nr:hypothetical protein [Alphaproteobacteria bacterium]
MTPDLARPLLDLVAEQLRRLESRAGRRAVRISVAIPTELDRVRAQELLEAALAPERTQPVEIELVTTEGRTRLLTVDFELAVP